MVQRIEFTIHTNIRPPPAHFFTQGQGQRSRSKIQKNNCQRDNLKNNFWFFPIFYGNLPMSMEMTRLYFQIPTDKQNGRHLATIFFFRLKFFFQNFLETWYIYYFGVCESIGIVRFHVRPKTRL